MSNKHQTDILSHHHYPLRIIGLSIFMLPAIFGVTFIAAFVVRSLSADPSVEQNATFLFPVGIIVFILFFWITVVANSWPAIRIREDGYDILFYYLYPFPKRWIALSWNDINRLRYDLNPIGVLLRPNRKTYVLFSKCLPFFYHLPGLFFWQSLQKGFSIVPWIRGYDQLASILEKKDVKYRFEVWS